MSQSGLRTLLGCLAVCVPSLAAQGVAASTSSFQDLNGAMWYYTTAHDYRFKDIERELDDLKSTGIRILGIYAPYHGDKHKWLGCDPLDFYAPPPQNGTLQDWKDLVAAAHARDMKVISYFVNIYIDASSEFFKTAEKQYRGGIRDAREVSTFHWVEESHVPTPEPAAGPSTWRYSYHARTFYWSLWGEAGLDFNLPGARAEIERIERFWLDTGLDGFMWDVGSINDRFRHSMIELPKTYPGDKWVTFESTDGVMGPQYDEFGLTAWFNHEDDDEANDYSLIALGERTADELESALTRTDFARSKEKTTYAWTLSPNREALAAYRQQPRLYVQEAALLAGAGITYGHSNYEQYLKWDPTLRADWNRVLATVNRNAALLPSASRIRVPAGSDPKVYAMRRTSKDGGQSVLLIYNFKGKPAKVTVHLAGTGLALKQTPVDLYDGAAAPAISGASYTVPLPAYGFRMLQVEASVK